jgi:hypothetical protein
VDVPQITKRYRDKLEALPLDCSLENQATGRGLADPLASLARRANKAVDDLHARVNKANQESWTVGEEQAA